MPRPAEIYYKGEFKNFKGIIFAKFDTIAERDKVVETFRRLVLKIQSEKVWSNADLPADVRIPKDFLFGLKKYLEVKPGDTILRIYGSIRRNKRFRYERS